MQRCFESQFCIFASKIGSDMPNFCRVLFVESTSATSVLAFHLLYSAKSLFPLPWTSIEHHQRVNSIIYEAYKELKWCQHTCLYSYFVLQAHQNNIGMWTKLINEWLWWILPLFLKCRDAMWDTSMHTNIAPWFGKDNRKAISHQKQNI